MKFVKNHLWFFSFLFLYFSLISIKIINKPLPFYDWDEAIYMEVGREMIEKKSLIPLWQGKYWLDKPPLVMIIYGLIPKIFFFFKPEISARLFNLFLNLFFYFLIYFFILKISRSKLTSFLVVFLTSLTPLFIQKAHTVNMDVFLGIGWVGYFLFYQNFLISTIFLALAIFSKSLLGFYPIFLFLVYYIFLFFLKKIPSKKLIKNIKILALQSFLFSLWYILMFIKFGNDFLYQHIYESHFKRVTASIEFHFGERLFYLFEISKQMGVFFYLSLIGLFIIVFFYLKRKVSFENFFNYNLFLPWFLFLNITKTKIYWYLYPAIPQFSFYFGSLINFLKEKIKNNWGKRVFLILIFFLIGYFGIVRNNFLTSAYSTQDEYYQLANFAKSNCAKIYFLPEESHRRSIQELEKMGLTIKTTKWWGGHPALVYYTDNKIEFFYNEKNFVKIINKKNKNECFAYFNNENLNFRPNQVKLLKQFGNVILYQ